MTQTISNQVSAVSYIFSKEDADRIIAMFKERARAKNVTAVDMLIYNLVRGKPSRNGFTPIKNRNKIVSNGGNPDNAYCQAERTLILHFIYPTRVYTELSSYLQIKPDLFLAHKEAIRKAFDPAYKSIIHIVP